MASFKLKKQAVNLLLLAGLTLSGCAGWIASSQPSEPVQAEVMKEEAQVEPAATLPASTDTLVAAYAEEKTASDLTAKEAEAPAGPALADSSAWSGMKPPASLC
jgi:hypothetical protein